MQFERLALDAAFQFTEEDLIENQKGKLSRSQAARIRGEMFRTAFWISLIVLIVTVLGLLSAGGVSAGEVQFIGVIAIAILVFLLWYYVVRIENVIRMGTVIAITGEANIIIGTGRPILQIADNFYPLTTTEARAFIIGNAYTIYMIPRLRRIVAAESYAGNPLDKRTAPKQNIPLTDVSDPGRESMRA